jgi:type III secretory pathway component EscS
MGSQSNNPFLINPFPPIIAANIPGIIVCLAQSLEEMSGKNLSLASLEAFVAIN